eukprot:5223595-Pleurochrysis_carterae.AAC.1
MEEEGRKSRHGAKHSDRSSERVLEKMGGEVVEETCEKEGVEREVRAWCKRRARERGSGERRVGEGVRGGRGVLEAVGEGFLTHSLHELQACKRGSGGRGGPPPAARAPARQACSRARASAPPRRHADQRNALRQISSGARRVSSASHRSSSNLYRSSPDPRRIPSDPRRGGAQPPPRNESCWRGLCAALAARAHSRAR